MPADHFLSNNSKNRIESDALILSAININGHGAGTAHNNLTDNHVRGELNENSSAFATLRKCFLVKSCHRLYILSYINRGMSFAHETGFNQNIRHGNMKNIYGESNPIHTPRGVDDDDDNKRIKRRLPFESLARWLA